MNPNESNQRLLTIERLKYLLEYKENGIFIWKNQPNSGGRKIGKRAGIQRPNGYRQLKIDGITYMEHRLVWFYHTMSWPKHQIDHINGKRCDNRIENLRKATYQQNRRNSITNRDNKSGFKGVIWHKRDKKWMASIGTNKKSIFLGYFSTAEEAHNAYCVAAKKFFGEFARFK